MRDIPGFVESRAAILAMKPGHKANWISFAVAHHLNGDHALAAQALKTYQGIQVRRPACSCAPDLTHNSLLQEG